MRPNERACLAQYKPTSARLADITRQILKAPKRQKRSCRLTQIKADADRGLSTLHDVGGSPMPATLSNFDAIYAEFRPKILRYLTGLVGPNEAEDLAQIVFLNVHGGLKDFRAEASLATWIYRIATNAAIDRLRKSPLGEAAQVQPNSDVPSDAAHDSEAADPADCAAVPSAETSFVRGEMNECIETFVDALPEIYRPVLVLSDLEGFKNREIAEILGLSVDTVKIRLHRARGELRKRFEAGCDFYRTEANELACDRKAPGKP